MITNAFKRTDRFTRLISGLRQIGVGSVATRSLSSVVYGCFLDDVKLSRLILASLLMLVTTVWLMLSPRVIYSKEFTWDLLFNLEGAWRLYTGQAPHLDFHTPNGTLMFSITFLAFKLTGLKPIAFVVGECILASAFTALAILAVKDRLPALPGFLFVFMCVALVLVPVTVGGELTAFTFAMGYNRFGWSALSMLLLILFIEPRERENAIRTDLVAASILTIAMFYLKITYFGVAVAAIPVALLTSRHVRRHWPWWCCTLLLVILVAFAPMNDGYRADILSASGHIHSNPVDLVRLIARVRVEQTIVFGEIILLLYLLSRRCATVGDVVSVLFIWISGLFLLFQNVENANASIPLYTVSALLLYVRLGNWLRRTTHQSLMLISCLMTCTLLPLSSLLLSNSITFIAYNIRAKQSSQPSGVTTTNLRGLVVPAGPEHILDEMAASYDTSDVLNQTRGWRIGSEPSQSEYLKMIVTLADFLRDEGAGSARIVVIDQVNPLPFVLGTPAPRGGNLWSGDGILWRAPEEALGEADYVAIPRFPTLRQTLLEGLNAYWDYLTTRFVQRFETPYWIVLERRKGL